MTTASNLFYESQLRACDRSLETLRLYIATLWRKYEENPTEPDIIAHISNLSKNLHEVSYIAAGALQTFDRE